jgi:hypothetical protein
LGGGLDGAPNLTAGLWLVIDDQHFQAMSARGYRRCHARRPGADDE